MHVTEVIAFRWEIWRSGRSQRSAVFNRTLKIWRKPKTIPPHGENDRWPAAANLTHVRLANCRRPKKRAEEIRPRFLDGTCAGRMRPHRRGSCGRSGSRFTSRLAPLPLHGRWPYGHRSQSRVEADEEGRE